MKKKLLGIFAIAAALCLAMALAGCGSNEPAAPADDAAPVADGTDPALAIDGLVDGKFVVGFDADFPPYGYIDGETGEYTGFDLDLAKEVCARNGWEFVATPINWDAKDGELNGGSISCIWNGFTIEGREDGYTFTPAYMNNSQVMVVKADSGINDINGLAGKTVATQVDSAALGVLESEDFASTVATFAALEQRDNFNTAFMELEAGAVDAVACDFSVAAYQMAAKPDAYTVIGDELSTEHFGVGFKLGNQALADAVTTTLLEMDKDGTVQQICEKYADQGVSYEGWCLK